MNKKDDRIVIDVGYIISILKKNITSIFLWMVFGLIV